MKGIITTLTLLAIAISLSSNANRMTEQFIPIGESPGISYKQTSVGIIDAIDQGNHEISLTDIDGLQKRYKVSDKTWIWLDKSKQGKSNTRGEFGNFKAEQTVEVKPMQGQPEQAEWVKIEQITH
jgi:hypothetical protein